MNLPKRLLDIGLALLLGLLLVPVLALLALLALALQGRPVFYLSERMQTPTRAFSLIKLRSMTVATTDRGVSGSDKAGRITPLGRFLRRTRADEIPQLWNILRGDMSFVGPRPPLRIYVERFPALYSQVLRNRPGVTGLASVVYHRHEERLLAGCDTADETDALYARVCVPRKARLDLIYARRQSLCFDMVLIGRTALGVFGGHRRPRR